MPLSPRRVGRLGVCDDCGDVLCCSLSTVGERQNSADGSAKWTRYSVPSRSGTPRRIYDDSDDVSCCSSSSVGTPQFSEWVYGRKVLTCASVPLAEWDASACVTTGLTCLLLFVFSWRTPKKRAANMPQDRRVWKCAWSALRGGTPRYV